MSIENIDINFSTVPDNSSSIKLNTDSSTIGPGIELLMNDKRKEKKSDVEININDLDNLEDELNNLSSSAQPPTLSSNLSSSLGLDSNMNSKLNSDPNETKSKNIFINKEKGESNNDLKKETTETWDGFKKFDKIPVEPNIEIIRNESMSKEDMLKEKFKYLKKLEALEKKGVELTKKYTMESSLLEMQGEYETIKAEKEKKNSVNFQGRMLMACVTGLEFLNNKMDPFDIKLDGWSEQVNENLDDYDEIFGELHEKYQSKAKMAPELKLLFQLTGSAIMLHMTNTMFKSSIPGMDDIMRQNPELMKQFTQAAVNQMGQEKPGFENFMNGINERSEPFIPNNGRPPSPIQTKNSSRMDNYVTRPDIGFGINSNSNGITINNQYENTNVEKSQRKRPEMKGPSDISDLLAGLKTNKNGPTLTSNTQTSNKSTSLNSNSNSVSKKSPSYKSKRRKISEKNTIALNI